MEEKKHETDAEGRVVLKLCHPLSGMSELKVRRLKAKDIRDANAFAPNDDLERGVRLGIAATGLTLLQFDELDVFDMENLMELVNSMRRKSS